MSFFPVDWNGSWCRISVAAPVTAPYSWGYNWTPQAHYRSDKSKSFKRGMATSQPSNCYSFRKIKRWNGFAWSRLFFTILQRALFCSADSKYGFLCQGRCTPLSRCLKIIFATVYNSIYKQKILLFHFLEPSLVGNRAFWLAENFRIFQVFSL